MLNLHQRHLGTAFDRRAEQNGTHWVYVRYNGASLDPGAIAGHRITPNPIAVDIGMEGQQELGALTGNPEFLHTWEIKVIRHTFAAYIASALAIAQVGKELEFTVEYALRANSRWDISLNEGASWRKMRLLGDFRSTPARYILPLVPLRDQS